MNRTGESERAEQFAQGIAISMISAPRVNPSAWFALAAIVPLALLAIAQAITGAGMARVAGFCVPLMLVPAALLAIRCLETRQYTDTAVPEHEQDLVHAATITTGQAAGLLTVVLLGARFSAEAVAVGLGVATIPLGMALGAYGLRRIFPPIEVGDGTKAADYLKVGAAAAREEPGAEQPAPEPVNAGVVYTLPLPKPPSPMVEEIPQAAEAATDLLADDDWTPVRRWAVG